MDYKNLYKAVFGNIPNRKNLWDGQYKIPWNDPDFSRRMLKEHLSQEHDLASRKKEIIEAQADWIHREICDSNPGRLLDIGCGPGFYIMEFLSLGYECTGIDFSPASIEYAQEKIGGGANLILGDIRETGFGTGFDIATMIYGEFNVFSPAECREILLKANSALVAGGKLLLEVHTFNAVKRIGEAPDGWYKEKTGLFSPNPHVCLIENFWFDDLYTSLQKFIVIDVLNGDVKSYRSTTKAWTEAEYKELLSDAGFVNISSRSDWPHNNNELFLITAEKSCK